MFTDVARVRDQLMAEKGNPGFDLQAIVRVFKNVTHIDDVEFLPYDVPDTNPIWGSFLRYERQPSLYALTQTFVQVRYAKHLQRDMMRFVVCKELCHALEKADGAHDASDRTIEKLVNEFAILSSERQLSQNLFRPLQIELLAEVAAFEILCPLTIRREIVSKNGGAKETLCEKIANDFDVPLPFVSASCDETHMNTIEQMFNDGHW